MHIATVKDSDWIVAIGGVRDAEFSDIDELLSKIRSISAVFQFQLFNADLISGWQHLYYAAVNAVNSYNSGSSISKSLAVEALLFASCQNQISNAFNMLGIRPGNKNIAILVFGKYKDSLLKILETITGLLGKEDDKVLEVNDIKQSILKKTYGISDLEITSVFNDDALSWLIIEHGALMRK